MAVESSIVPPFFAAPMPTSLPILPPYLAERVRPRPGGVPAHGARFTCYWTRAALRAHENPALVVALAHAGALGIPVFVYHALSERYPYASDRHHHFILEGARDFAQPRVARGIGTAFHLERPGYRGPHLLALARQAAAYAAVVRR